MSRIALRGTAVAKRFGRVTALRGIDFEIGAGEAVAILGANGAGKSTLLRILAGLSRASDGAFEALRDANDSNALPRQELRREVGYVGHATLLYGELSASENLLFAARLAGTRANAAEIDELLETVGLTDFATRRAGTFSRGMSQRLAIARAIVHDPSVLLLDEPFTGLDEVSAERLSTQLAALRAGGRTLVVVTHDPRRAVELADRALILHRGKIVARPARSERSARLDASAQPSQAAPLEADTAESPAIEFDAESLRAHLFAIAHSTTQDAA